MKIYEVQIVGTMNLPGKSGASSVRAYQAPPKGQDPRPDYDITLLPNRTFLVKRLTGVEAGKARILPMEQVRNFEPFPDEVAKLEQRASEGKRAA